MPTSSYMPDVKVEIAFDSGFNTPAASRTWTDVSQYVELAGGITITGGRSDERSTADANQLTLTLDNSDGRFTPFKTGGAYYPNVKLDRPIRVKADPVDGVETVRFLGFVNDWSVDWADTDGYAKVTISASTRIARLGMVAALKSIVESTVLVDSPGAYYTLAEPDGSTQANDSSGNRGRPLVVAGDQDAAAVVFGNAIGPGTDGLTAAEFAGGRWLEGGSFTPTSTNVSIDFAFLVGAAPASLMRLWSVVALQAMSGFQIMMTSTGTLQMYDATGSAVGAATATSYANDATHWGTLTLAGTTWTLYIDGVSVATAAGTAPSTSFTYAIRLGGGDGVAIGLTGVLAHFAAYSSVLNGASIASHSGAALTGFAGETTSARLIRYATLGGVESAAIVAETGQTTVQHIDTTGQQVVDLMRLMETTEGGVLFDDRDGTTAFHNRTHRPTATSLFTLDMAQQQVEADYQPRLDRTGLLNDVTAQDVTGRYTAHVFDATSQTDYGRSVGSIETASEDDDEPLFLSSWLLYKYKDPLVRIPTLSVDATAQVGKTPNCFTVMSANVGSLITVSNRPTQDSTPSATFFVEGYTEVYGPESLVITFNVSPAQPEDNTYIVDNNTGRGVLGTNPIAL